MLRFRAPKARELPPAGSRLPLHLLMGFAQVDMPNLQRLLDASSRAVEHGGDVELPAHSLDEDFFKHKVRDLAEQQFEPHRAVAELVSNAIDSVAGSRDKTVRVTVSKKGVVVEDCGRGMTLDEMHTALSVPFQQAEAGKPIGRFGVGFFSNLSFLARGEAQGIRVESRRSGKAHFFEYEVERPAGGTEYYARVGKSGRGEGGTKVSIIPNGKFRRDTVQDIIATLRETFEELDPDVARLEINGKPYLPSKASRLRETAVLETPHGALNLWADAGSRDGVMLLKQGGSVIRALDFNGGKVVIDIPRAFSPGEGRKGFVNDEKYSRAMAGAFGWLCGYSRRNLEGARGRKALRQAGWFENGLFSHAMRNDASSPLHAFSVSASPGEMRSVLGALLKGHPNAGAHEREFVRSSNWLAEHSRDFLSRDAHAFHEWHPLFPQAMQNVGLKTLSEFLKSREVKAATVGQLPTRECRKYSLQKLPAGVNVHLLRLSPENPNPVMALSTRYNAPDAPANVPDGYPDAGVYVNVNHPWFSSPSKTARAALEALMKKYEGVKW